jgi:hypothetical protein
MKMSGSAQSASLWSANEGLKRSKRKKKLKSDKGSTVNAGKRSIWRTRLRRKNSRKRGKRSRPRRTKRRKRESK